METLIFTSIRSLLLVVYRGFVMRHLAYLEQGCSKRRLVSRHSSRQQKDLHRVWTLDLAARERYKATSPSLGRTSTQTSFGIKEAKALAGGRQQPHHLNALLPELQFHVRTRKVRIKDHIGHREGGYSRNEGGASLSAELRVFP